MQITAGGQTFAVTLLDHPAARAFRERLPLTVRMEDLNGNEKYGSLPGPLPVDSQRPGEIQAGDLMLYGSDCLVLFYESWGEWNIQAVSPPRWEREAWESCSKGHNAVFQT